MLDCYSSIVTLSILITLSFSVPIRGQTKFLEQRAEEDYSHLKDSTNLSWPQAVKYIAFDSPKNAYLSIGGTFRSRFEHFTNNRWMEGNDENYYTQRLAFHADIHFSKHIRFFGELQHAYKSDGEAFLQNDDLDVHQAFIEFRTSTSNNDNQFALRFGRQEMKLGVGRLVDLRIGPNVRRAFDIGRLTLSNDKLHMDLFYGKEAEINFDAFDNRFTFFEDGAANSRLWGIYNQFQIRHNKEVKHTLELYYVGFQSNFSAYSDVAGEETRHSIGARSFGSINRRFHYNTEFIYQFGDLAGSNISAFNFETDWKYVIDFGNWRPTAVLKLDWSSGDSEAGDGHLNSFNPMFVNPATYSLAAVNTPINLLSFHPSLLLFPSKKWLINVEYAFFYRTNKSDGFYSPPRIQSRLADGIPDRHIGDVFGLFLQYTHNPNLAFDIRSSYFISADYIEESGASEPIFQFAATGALTF